MFNGQPGIMCTIELIKSTGLNYIMFAHNSVFLRNWNHPENNFMLTGFEPTPMILLCFSTPTNNFLVLRNNFFFFYQGMSIFPMLTSKSVYIQCGTHRISNIYPRTLAFQRAQRVCILSIFHACTQHLHIFFMSLFSDVFDSCFRT